MSYCLFYDLYRPQRMKPTKEWLKEGLPHPYNELALSVVDENWEHYTDYSHSLPDAIVYMCNWLDTSQKDKFWGEVWDWADDPQRCSLPPIPEPIIEGTVEIPMKEQPKDWQVMYWEMAQARTSAVKEVQELKNRVAELEQKYNDTEAGFAFYQTEIKVLQEENARLDKEQRQLEVDKYHSDSNLGLVTDKLSMLEQSVKDAISEMEVLEKENESKRESEDSSWYLGIAQGFEDAIKLLKQKTGL